MAKLALCNACSLKNEDFNAFAHTYGDLQCFACFACSKLWDLQGDVQFGVVYLMFRNFLTLKKATQPNCARPQPYCQTVAACHFGIGKFMFLDGVLNRNIFALINYVDL